MKVIARYGSGGARLNDLASHTKVTRPTVHRILKALTDEGMIVQNSETRRYHLGEVVHQLGLVAFQRMDVVPRLRPLLVDLAHKTGNTAYLMTVSGFDIVCLDRIDGSFPVRAYTFEIGRRSPLGAGAASLAFLSLRSDGDLDRILDVNGPALREYGYQSLQPLRNDVMKARRRGVGISRGRIAAGVVALSALIPNPKGTPYLAVSVAAPSPQMPRERIEKLSLLLQKWTALASHELAS